MSAPAHLSTPYPVHTLSCPHPIMSTPYHVHTTRIVAKTELAACHMRQVRLSTPCSSTPQRCEEAELAAAVQTRRTGAAEERLAQLEAQLADANRELQSLRWQVGVVWGPGVGHAGCGAHGLNVCVGGGSRTLQRRQGEPAPSKCMPVTQRNVERRRRLHMLSVSQSMVCRIACQHSRSTAFSPGVRSASKAGRPCGGPSWSPCNSFVTPSQRSSHFVMVPV
eukprot:350131-Chlamydomonas_euryale.AAC.1